MSEIYDSKRMLRNTFFLYGRMLVTFFLHLLSTRLVLQNLGAEDMGTYAVVTSVVGSMIFLGGSLGNAVQRFVTYELGRMGGNLNNVFNTCLNAVILIAVVLFVLLETLGLWLLLNKLNIPIETKSSALFAYQFSLAASIINIINIPYDSIIVAHEKMNVMACVQIIETILKCIVAFFIAFVENRLLVYAFGLMTVSMMMRLFYQVYCRKMFSQDVKYRRKIDKRVIKEIGRYFGITSINVMLNTISLQGITWVINLVSGVAINAVYSIANQLKNTLLSFSMNINRAISPQITKTYANGMMEEHKNLVNVGMRLNSFMSLLLLFPFVFCANSIMNMWLKDVPEYAVFFVQIIAFSAFFDSLMQSIASAVFATGRIKGFLLVTRAFYLLVLPLMYVLYQYTQSPKSIICSVVLMDFMAVLIQMTIVARQRIVEVKEGLIIPLYRIGIVTICSFLVSMGLHLLLPQGTIGVVAMFALHGCAILPVIFCVGAKKTEKEKIVVKVRELYYRVFCKRK